MRQVGETYAVAVPDPNRPGPGFTRCSAGAPEVAIVIAHERDGELEGDTSAILPYRGDGEQFPTIAGNARRHHRPVACPMTGAEAFGDDQIQRLSHRFAGGMAEHRLGSTVPVDDRAGAVRDDHSLRHLFDDALEQRRRELGHRAPFFTCESPRAGFGSDPSGRSILSARRRT